jgi:hypothetical protein
MTEFEPDGRKNLTEYSSLFNKRESINESFSFYSRERKAFVPNQSAALLEEEVFGADVSIKIADYQLLPTMIETLREIIPLSQHRKIRGKDVVRVFNLDTKDYWQYDPVYVIDGVMTDDTHYFLSLNPTDIVTIKLLHSADKLSAFGSIGRGGMFLVETKIPENYENVHRSVRTFSIKGLNERVQRRNVLHNSGENNRVPDLRTNLFWLPDTQTNSNGEATLTFYASDVPGKYKIQGEGITKDGKLFTFEEAFEVVFRGSSAQN